MTANTQRVYPQIMAEANWYSIATLTASAYTQIVAPNGERSSGVWIYNNNTVSVTSEAFLYRTAAPANEGTDVIRIQPIYTTLSGTVQGRHTIFIPGTGAVFARSVNAGVLASLLVIES